MPRASFLADLRRVLAERNFRRLFATRLVSQAGDGLFTAGISSYVFFSKSTFPNPATAAAAFTVLYLPYSLIGPFAGVFIDRWSRRQILVWSALVRAALVVLTASLVGSGSLGLPLYISVLGVFGVNRFFLSSLSAALPRVVTDDVLVMANSVSTTCGTMATFVGALAGLGAHLVTGSGRAGSAVIVVAAAGCYGLSGAVGATMGRDLLGPPPLPPGVKRALLRTELAVVVKGLAGGARHVWERRPAAAALAATGGQRAIYGILLLASILLYRNYFYRSANASLASYILVVIASALGYGAAMVFIPMVTRRVSKAACIALLLVSGGVITGALGPTFAQPAFLVIGLLLGVVAQGVTICATTVLQQQMDDGYRGRVFALYDMLFNVPFVIGAVIAAQIIPDNGKSYLLIAVAAVGYVLAGLGYALVSRQELLAGPLPAGGSPAGGSPGEPPGPPGPGLPEGDWRPGSSPSPSAQRRSS